MLRAYRSALSLPGTFRFSSTGFLARLPIAMVGLGIVLLVSETTGSYAAAGALSAAFQLPAALGAVVTSRWTDRLGQSRTLPWLGGLSASFLVAFVVSVQLGAPVLVVGADYRDARRIGDLANAPSRSCTSIDTLAQDMRGSRCVPMIDPDACR